VFVDVTEFEGKGNFFLGFQEGYMMDVGVFFLTNCEGKCSFKLQR
jgi:hypothetical protein